MTEENNIEQEIIKEFHQVAKENHSISAPNWNSFIENPANIKNIDSIKIEIDYDLRLENWNFTKLNFEFLIKGNYNINFTNCSFNSLNIISWDNFLLNDLLIRKCNFKGDVQINIKSQAQISIDHSEFHGNKCIINYPMSNL